MDHTMGFKKYSEAWEKSNRMIDEAKIKESAANSEVFGKYIVMKTDGTEIKKGSKYFVLNVNSDKHAIVAMKAYAESIREENKALYKEVLEYIK